jgi:hypothetical protein
METINKQPGSTAAKKEGTQTGQSKTDTAGKEQPGDWKDRLTDKVTGDNDIFKSLLRQLTNPLTLLIVVLAWFYWQHRKTAVKKDVVLPPDIKDNPTDFEQQLKKAKKKNKRLKKQLLHQQQAHTLRNGSYQEQMA